MYEKNGRLFFDRPYETEDTDLDPEMGAEFAQDALCIVWATRARLRAEAEQLQMSPDHAQKAMAWQSYNRALQLQQTAAELSEIVFTQAVA
jgi:hypothetical protein